MARLAFLLLAALGLSCGGGLGSGTASLSGTVRGEAQTPKGAVSSTATIETTVGPANVAVVVLSNPGGLCAEVSANREPKSAQYLLLFLGVLSAQDGGAATIIAPTAGGDFAVYSGVGQPASTSLAIVLAQTTDAACHDQTALDATGISGTVHVSNLGKGIAGSLDVMLAAGVDGNGQPTSALEHLTGSFSASDCPGLGALVSATRTTQCAQ